MLLVILILFFSILQAIRNHDKIKVHSPGVCGEIGGYPYVIDGSHRTVTSYFDTSVFSMEEMREANRKSIYLDGIENVADGKFVLYSGIDYESA